MPYLGRPGEIVVKQCEKCGDLLAYKADGKNQPLTCESCFAVDGIEYISKWNICLLNTDHDEYVIPLGVPSRKAVEIVHSCNEEIKRGGKQAQYWVNAWAVPCGWPYFDDGD